MIRHLMGHKKILVTIAVLALGSSALAQVNKTAPFTKGKQTTTTTQPKTAESPTAEAPKADATSSANASAPAAPAATAPVPAVKPPEEIAAPKEAQDDSANRYGKTKGILGDFTFGPSVSILGVPHPFQFALQMKYQDWIGGQISYLYIPDITISSVKVGLTGYDARLRFFPFRGSFYLGAAVLGHHKIHGTKTQTISGVPVTADVTVESDFLTPQLGWRWQWKSGFFMGLDLGWQLNRNAKTTVTSNAPALIQTQAEYTALVNDVQDLGNDIGNKGIPNITLIQFGFML